MDTTKKNIFCDKVGKGQGSTKWVSGVSEITEASISHGNPSLEITYKMPKKWYFEQNKVWSQKQYTVTEKLFLCDRNKLHRRRRKYVTVFVRQKVPQVKTFLSGYKFLSEYPSEKHILVREEEKSYCDRNKFLSQD